MYPARPPRTELAVVTRPTRLACTALAALPALPALAGPAAFAALVLFAALAAPAVLFLCWQILLFLQLLSCLVLSCLTLLCLVLSCLVLFCLPVLALPWLGFSYFVCCLWGSVTDCWLDFGLIVLVSFSGSASIASLCCCSLA